MKERLRRASGRNRACRLVLTAWLLPATLALAAQGSDSGRPPSNPGRFPEGNWLRYADVTEAGFSNERLDLAHRYWERRSMAALLVVANGAVVVSWGEADRRFPVHSIRKSLLSALYGVYQDDIELNQTLDELGIDDQPPLTPAERQARVVDVIGSRSGVYHEAAGEPSEMTAARPPRGSHPPGRYWWYNNWDFNVAGAVFEKLARESVFTAFRNTIAEPIGMQDYRLADGFYNREPEKALHPSFSMRMSSRDLARFGLLFARGGRWGREQIIPRPWVEESTRVHSEIDLGSELGTGYGYMWWVEGTRGFAARGYGGHALLVYPADDLVVVVRADTYHDRFVSNQEIARVVRLIRAAREGEPVPTPTLEVLVPEARESGEPRSSASVEALDRYVGEIHLEGGGAVEVSLGDGRLMLDYGRGLFPLRPVSPGRFMTEDSRNPVVFEFSPEGTVQRILTEPVIYMEAAAAVRRGEVARAVAWVEKAVETFPESPDAHYNLAKALNGTGRPLEAIGQLELALNLDPGHRAAAALLTSLRIRRYTPPLVAALIGGVAIAVGIRRRRRVRRAGEKR